MRTLAALALLLAAAPQEERELAKAARATADKGSFTFQVRPTADLRDALPQDRAAVAGVPIAGELLADGTYHATDGANELWGRGLKVVLKTKAGWEPAESVVKDLLLQIKSGAGEEWRQGNVTQAKAAFRQIFALAHLASKSIPPTAPLQDLEKDFKALKKSGDSYEGELKDLVASKVLEGPFEWLIKEGRLSVSEYSGRGRATISSDGFVRRLEQKAAGIYTVVEDGKKRRVPAAVEVVIEYSKVGTTVREIPKDADAALKDLESAGK